MPIRTRIEAPAVRAVDAISAFRWTRDGCGFEDHALGDPCFRDRREAARAWQSVRRQVWASAARYTVPAPATFYDGLTATAVEHVRWCWGYTGAFDLPGVLEALAEDRAALATFAATRAARQIDDYLELFTADLAEVERTALALAAVPANEWRPYPGHLNTGHTYGRVERGS